MTSIVPPSQPVPQPAAQPVGGTMQAVNPPAGASALTPGQSLQVVLSGQTVQGTLQVQTPLGPMALQTTAPLPHNAVLGLIVQQTTPALIFTIQTINGQKAQQPTPQQLQNALKAQMTPETLQAQGKADIGQLPPLQTGQKTWATLLRPATLLPAAQGAQPGQATPPPQASTQPGQAVSGATAQAQGPQSSAAQPAATQSTTPAATVKGGGTAPALQTGGQGASTPAPAPSTPTQPGTPAQTPAQASSAPQPQAQQASAQAANTRVTLPQGTRIPVQIQTITQPGQTAPTPANPAPGGALPSAGQGVVAQVTGTTPQGQPMIQITPPLSAGGNNAALLLALGAKSSMAEGTQLGLKIDGAPELPALQPAERSLAQAAAKEGLVRAPKWSALDDVLKVLTQADPPRFQHLTQNVLPQPGGKLTAQLLFFLSALKGGDLSAWTGDSVLRVLERARPGSTQRLSGDFQIMQRLEGEPQGDWKLALIPFWDEGKLEQIRFYHRGGQSGEDDEDEDDSTRFVLDVTLSKMGHVQIDGLSGNDPKRLNLIIRTDHPLPKDMQSHIAKLMQTLQDTTGLKGSVSFQTEPANFIAFEPENRPTEMTMTGLIA